MSAPNQTDNQSQVQYLLNQLTLARREINNLRQQLKTQVLVYKKEIHEVNQKLENWQCSECRNRQNASHETSQEDRERPFAVNYIGTIYTDFPEKRGTPRQTGICSNATAKLTLNNETFTNPEHALEGLQEYSHMWVLFHFHRNNATHVRAKVAPPRLNGARTGVLATRSPHRPCPIGLSLVKIEGISQSTVYFSGVDMVDRTPVLDIKPYIPQYDSPFDCRNGGGLIREAETLNGPASAQPSTSRHPQVEIVTSRVESLNINTRELDGEENRRGDVVLGAAAGNHNSRYPLEESLYNRSNSRIGEREAPDGEEEEPPQAATNQPAVANARNDIVRVPPWLDSPAVSLLSVTFKDRALEQLRVLGDEGEEKKRIITNVLREDPRSVYLRQRWSSHCYVFRIAELCVSCKFNDSTHEVVVYQVFQGETANVSEQCDDSP